MDDSRVYSELSSFINHTLGLYENGVDPSRINGMWCKRIVKEWCCTFKKLDKCNHPSAKMIDWDVVAIVKEIIFKDEYSFYRKLKEKYPFYHFGLDEKRGCDMW
jgi:hypothetical protein